MALLLTAVTSASATDAKLFHWQTNATAPALSTPMNASKGGAPSVGTAVWEGEEAPGTESATYDSSVTDSELKGSSGNKALKLGKSNLSLKITLVSPLKTGDVISICGYNPFKIGTTESATHAAGTEISASLATGTGKGAYKVGTVTITSEMIATIGSNVKTLYISRAVGSGTGLAAIKITRDISAPLITEQPEDALYAIGDTPEDLKVSAVSSGGSLTYAWKSYAFGGDKASAVDAAGTNNEATYTPSTASASKNNYYCVVSDDNGSTESDAAVIEVIAASAPTKPTIDGVPVSAVAKNASVTLTASSTGAPEPTYQWYSCTALDKTGAAAIAGATEETYSPSTATAGTFFYYVVATNSQGSEESDVVSFTVNASSACELTRVLFSNGFEGFIKLGTPNTITAYYMEGESVPTVTATTISDDATYTVVGSTLTVTAEDGTTNKEFTISLTAVAPTNEPNRTFNGAEDWVKTGGAFNNTSDKKGWTINKNTEEASNKRISEGKNRIYFFVENATKIILYPSTKNGSDRNIKYTINGGSETSATFPKWESGKDKKLEITTGAKAMVRITNLGSGDLSIGSIVIDGLASPATTVTVSTGSGKTYATYVTANALDFSTKSSEITAYIATAATADAVTVEPVTLVAAGTPLLIKTASAGASVDVPYYTTGDLDDVSGNKLVASDGVTKIGGDDKYDYILSSGKFYRATEGVLAAGKAYLHLDAAPSAPELNIIVGGENADDITTGISAIDNGRLTIDNAKVYNLNGQRISNPTKGLYIVNGKKVIMK